MLEACYVREGGWLSVCDAAVFHSAGGIGRPSRLWNLASPLFHDLPTAQQTLDQWVASLDECSDFRALAASSNARSHDVHPPDILDGLRSWGEGWDWLGPLRVQYAMRCNMDAALTMLALEAFRGRAGHYPDELVQLMPDFLPRLPVDYADRQLLRYRRAGDGYKLYSIGHDGRDDGGEPDRYPWDEWGYFGQEAPEIVFSAIRRPGAP